MADLSITDKQVHTSPTITADGKITATKKNVPSDRLVSAQFHNAITATENTATGNEGIYVMGVYEGTGGSLTWEPQKLNLTDPLNCYWADQKLTTTAKTDTTPTFASTKFKIGQSVVTVAPNANQLANIALTLPQDAGTLVSTGTVLILNGGN